MSLETPSADHRTLDAAVIRSIATAIACVATVGIGLALALPLLSIRLEAMGVSRTVIGLHVAAGAVMNIVFAPLVPRIAARFGVRPTMGVAVAACVVSFVLFPLFETPTAWLFIRLLLSMGLVTLFAVSEFWINAVTPEPRRGLVLGVYATALSVGFAVGPAVLSLVGSAGMAPFLIGAALAGLAGLPVLFATGAPALHETSQRSVLFFVLAAPAATFAALTFGAVETSAMSFITLYGLRIGLDEAAATLLLSVMVIGNVLFQAPIGWLADRFDKRAVLLCCAVMGVAGGVAMPLAAGNMLLLLPTLFVWGGVVSALYTVGLAHLGSRFRGPDLASANAAFIMLYSTGMLVGPPAIGAAMDLYDPHGLPLGLAAFFAAYVAIVAIRMVRAPDRA